MIANCEFFQSSQSTDSQNDLEHIVLYGTGLTIAIVRFTIWPN